MLHGKLTVRVSRKSILFSINIVRDMVVNIMKKFFLILMMRFMMTMDVIVNLFLD